MLKALAMSGRTESSRGMGEVVGGEVVGGVVVVVGVGMGVSEGELILK